MQIRNFERVSYKFSFFDTNNRPVNGLAVILQYFSATTQVWEEIVRGVINNGTFLFEEATAPNSQTRSGYLDDNIIPEMRIVPAVPVYSYSKQQVLAAFYQISLNPQSTPSLITFDFGSAYLAEKEVIDGFDSFRDFVLISTRISLVNQQANLAQIKLLQSDLAACKTTNAQLTKDNAALQSDNNAKAQEIAALKLEISAKNETIATLNAQLISALSDVEENALEIARLNSIQVNFENTIADLQRQIAELSRIINFDDRPVAVNTLYSNLIREIDTSAANNANANFKLTNISVKLKALVSTDEDGINAQLFGLSNTNLVNDSTVSELTFDIAPQVAPSSQTGKLPNLLGLTETAVRRILDSLGLRLNQVFQNNPKKPNGDSFKQSPEEGTAYNSNDIITVIFSKHE